METDSLEQRLDRLERQCRRWRWAGIVFATLVGTPVLATLVAFMTADGDRVPERLVIRDKEGRVRIDMGTWKDGSPRLLFAGASGTPRLEIRVGAGDVPSIEMLDEDRKVRLSMDVGETGPTLSLRDKDEKPRAMLMLGNDGSPGLSLHDVTGGLRLMAGLEGNGTSKITFSDSNEKVRMVVGINKDGLPALGLTDATGAVRFQIQLDQDGNPVATRTRP